MYCGVQKAPIETVHPQANHGGAVEWPERFDIEDYFKVRRERKHTDLACDKTNANK